MKVTGIHIENFHQFKSLDIDLTYPKGHVKEGEPLDKVCFIGQSGTGKTKLLEIIGGLTFNYHSFINKYNFSHYNGIISIKDFDLTYTIRISPTYNFLYSIENGKKNGEHIEKSECIAEIEKNVLESKPNLIYYPAEFRYDIIPETISEDFKERSIIDFGIERISTLWNIIFNEIQRHQEKELVIRQEISRIVEDNKNDITAITRALKTLEDWKKNNFNPLEDLAKNCLDPILEKFRLRVKTKLDIKRKEDIGFIKIEDINGNEIPFALWSTGTKQSVLSILPLYLLKPIGTIILYDEPERSLYPDLQKVIIDYYRQHTADCQFFFATHSPIIASSFEPWEIIELKFNAQGYIEQEKYYEGERHVDNYTVSPDHLTYDLILSKVFDLKETYSPVRDEKITEVLMLRNQLEKLKKEGKLSTPEGESLYDEYMKLAKKLSWEFELPQYEKA